MAGDWIKMREDLHEDPAVLFIARRLETRPEHVVGYCHKFWSWVSRQCYDGSVTGVTLDSLGSVLSLPGFPQLLVEVGWLKYEETPHSMPVIEIPNFDRHLSQGAKSRGLASIRVRNARVTKPLRNKRNKSVTREEKSREEKNKGDLSPLNPLAAALPFQSESFFAVWQAWVAHRTEKHKPLTPTSLKRQLADLGAMGEPRAIAALNWSIRNGWTGIFEQEVRNGKPAAAKPGPGQRYTGD